jgi:hypothetical protein
MASRVVLSSVELLSWHRCEIDLHFCLHPTKSSSRKHNVKGRADCSHQSDVIDSWRRNREGACIVSLSAIANWRQTRGCCSNLLSGPRQYFRKQFVPCPLRSDSFRNETFVQSDSRGFPTKQIKGYFTDDPLGSACLHSDTPRSWPQEVFTIKCCAGISSAKHTYVSSGRKHWKLVYLQAIASQGNICNDICFREWPHDTSVADNTCLVFWDQIVAAARNILNLNFPGSLNVRFVNWR